MELSMFRAIHASELYDCAWQKDDKEQLAPNVLRITRHFNKVGFKKSSFYFFKDSVFFFFVLFCFEERKKKFIKFIVLKFR
jgi:ACT domain-containing protein